MPRTVDTNERLGEIAAAVRRVVETRGVDCVSIRSVADELGSSTGLITHWVSSRAELIHVAVAVTASEQTARALDVLDRQPHDLAGALEEWLPLDARRLGEMKVWLAFWALAANDAALQAEHRSRYRSFRRDLSRRLRERGLTVSTATHAADRIIVTIDGIAVAAVLDPDHWTPARQRRQLSAVLVQTLPS